MFSILYRGEISSGTRISNFIPFHYTTLRLYFSCVIAAVYTKEKSLKKQIRYGDRSSLVFVNTCIFFAKFQSEVMILNKLFLENQTLFKSTT